MRTKKIIRFIVLILLLAAVLMTSSCIHWFQSPIIGISTSDTIGMTGKVVDDIVAMAESDGYPVSMLDANGQYETQEMQISSLIAEEVNVLAICPVDADDIQKSLEAAATAEIPVVLFERSLDEGDVAFFAGYDAAGEATAAAQAIVEADDGKENIVVEIIGPEDNPNAVAASSAFHDVIDLVDNITVVQIVSNWNVQSAYDGMKSVLKKYPTISAIYCSNSTLEVSIDAALDELGLLQQVGTDDHIYRVSVSGSKNGYDSMANGYIDLLIVTDVDSEIQAIYDALVTLGNGKSLETTSSTASYVAYTQSEIALNKSDIWGYASEIE